MVEIIVTGRPPVITEEKGEEILALRAQGETIRAIAALVGVNKSSVGRYVKENYDEQ